MSPRTRRWFWSALIVAAPLAGASAIALLWVVEFQTGAGRAVGILGWVTETPLSKGGRAVGVDPVALIASVALTALTVVLVAGVVLLALLELIRPANAPEGREC